jgi:hypothetical protein
MYGRLCEVPACGILHILHNLYIDMRYGELCITGEKGFASGEANEKDF